MRDFEEKMCPRCHHAGMKRWEELTGDERFLVERLPASKDFSLEERKRHRFCPRCWFESVDRPPQNV
jgi:ribosomal protein S27AE